MGRFAGRPATNLERVDDVSPDPVISAECDRPGSQQPQRGLGIDKGLFEVPDDFDDPLPREILRYFTDGDPLEP
jgi:hypothetical protein